MPLNEASILRVEGKDDVHAIGHLLLRHGIDCRGVQVDIKSADSNGDETTGGRTALLAGMKTEVMSSTDRSIGFILDVDAEEDAEDPWRAVCGQLGGIGLTLPAVIPEEGFVGEATIVQARVGVWLMPDNRHSGALEEFLRGLVDAGDSLLPIAEQSTHRAKEQGARFADSARRKAVLHAWLAWQERPGLPYGSAIRARYFGHDSAAALAFVEWFKRVFTDHLTEAA